MCQAGRQLAGRSFYVHKKGDKLAKDKLELLIRLAGGSVVARRAAGNCVNWSGNGSLSDDDIIVRTEQLQRGGSLGTAQAHDPHSNGNGNGANDARKDRRVLLETWHVEWRCRRRRPRVRAKAKAVPTATAPR